jgi:hypothetical protein
MKKLLILFSLLPFVIYSQTGTVIEPRIDAQTLNGFASSYFVDTATNQTISGNKTFMDNLFLNAYGVLGTSGMILNGSDTLVDANAVYDYIDTTAVLFWGDTISLLGTKYDVDTLAASVYDTLLAHLDSLQSHDIRINANLDSLADHLDTLQAHDTRINNNYDSIFWSDDGTDLFPKSTRNLDITGTILATTSLTVGDDILNTSGQINGIASDGDASDILWNTSDQITFNNAGSGYVFDGKIYSNDSYIWESGTELKFRAASGSTYGFGAGASGGNVVTISETGDLVAATILSDSSITVSSNLINSVETSITASTTQAQGQQPLTKDINEVATVGNANDVVTLQTAIAGLEIFIINNGANVLQIFPASGDDLGAGVNTSTTLAAGSNVTFVSFDATNWEIK